MFIIGNFSKQVAAVYTSITDMIKIPLNKLFNLLQSRFMI